MAKSVLIVDDSTSMRQMLSYTLKEAGYQVTEGENGQQGLDRVKGARFDLIITDLNMPVLDGIGFIKGVRQQQACKFTPILMLTTETNPEKKQAGKEAGATGWIVKPFDPSKLLQTISKLLP